MGTADYIAPEQTGDSHAVDVRADIYSLGCTLYKLLTGEAPYTGPEFNTTLKKTLAHLGQPLPDPRSRRPDLPAALLEALRRMTAKQPSDRYATPAEVAAAFAPFAVAADLPALVAAVEKAPSGALGTDHVSGLESVRNGLGGILFEHTVPAAGTDAHLSSALVETDAGTGPAGLVPVPGSVRSGLPAVVDSANDFPETVLDAAGLAVPPRFTRGRYAVLAAAAGFFFLAFGIWVIIRDRDGSEVARYRLRDGESVTTEDDGSGTSDAPAQPVDEPLDPADGASASPTPDEALVGANDSESLPVRHTVDEEYVARVAELPAEEQVAAVAEMLQSLNPGFDGQVQHVIENDTVIHFSFLTDQVTDISPLRALADLGSLDCSGSAPGYGLLDDLSPLKGLALKYLCCRYNRVSDLSPLDGMPLTRLECLHTQVSDLSALKGMPLTSLNCGDTQVSDLSPLAGMPLTALYCGYTRVSDLSPLDGMPLTRLECHDTQVSDLSALEGMPLTNLVCSDMPVSDLSPLEGMGIHDLTCDFRLFHADDERIVRSLPLETYSNLPVAEFWSQVEARRRASDEFVSAVAGLSPDELATAVRKRLQELNPGLGVRFQTEADVVTEAALTFPEVTNAADLTPLRALTALRTLTLRGVGPLADLSPLNCLPLEELTCNVEALGKNAPVLRSVATLKTVNGQTLDAALDAAVRPDAALIHSQVDAEFVARVAELSAEEQVAAVTEKLQSLNPGFDGQVQHTIENGTVIQLSFLTDQVTDISPVRALADLRSMDFSGSAPGYGLLEDLSPLKGLALEYLCCHYNRVFDLSPLAGMPLTSLACTETQVSDLSPLEGMPLTSVFCSHTQVSNLSPLAGMPLTNLVCNESAVSDLSPLEGMEFHVLGCDLRLFHAEDERIVRSLSVETLNQLPAAEFWNQIEARRRASDEFAAAVAELNPRERAAAVRTRLQEINPGLGVRLETEADVVTEAALTFPGIANAADLTPLRALTALRTLTLRGVGPLADLSPLNCLPLEELTCNADPLRKNARILQGIATLRTVNGQPLDAALDAAANAQSP